MFQIDGIVDWKRKASIVRKEFISDKREGFTIFLLIYFTKRHLLKSSNVRVWQPMPHNK